MFKCVKCEGELFIKDSDSDIKDVGRLGKVQTEKESTYFCYDCNCSVKSNLNFEGLFYISKEKADE